MNVKKTRPCKNSRLVYYHVAGVPLSTLIQLTRVASISNVRIRLLKDPNLGKRLEEFKDLLDYASEYYLENYPRIRLSEAKTARYDYYFSNIERNDRLERDKVNLLLYQLVGVWLYDELNLKGAREDALLALPLSLNVSANVRVSKGRLLQENVKCVQANRQGRYCRLIREMVDVAGECLSPALNNITQETHTNEAENNE